MKRYFLSGMALALLAIGMTTSSPVHAARGCTAANQGATYTLPYMNYPNYFEVYMCIGTSYVLLDIVACSGPSGQCTSL